MYRILYFVILISVMSCSSTKNVFKFKAEDKVIGLKKGTGYGKFSVYNVDIYKNKYVVYEGLANVEKYGVFSKILSEAEFAALISDFEKSQFFDFKDEYPSDILDFPTIVLTYKNDQKSKTITGKLDRPEAILQLQYSLEKLAATSGWKLEKAYVNDTAPEKEVMPERKMPKESIIDNQIIVEPSPNVFMNQWLKKYASYDLKLIKPIAPNLNLFLITFNKGKISGEDMLKMIRSDKEIKNAEFNKVVQPREH